MNRQHPGKLIQLVASLMLTGAMLPATAALQTIEQAYELTRHQLQLPTKADNRLRVRPCPKCPTAVLQITAETQWFLAPGADTANRKEWQAAFQQAALQPATLIYVYYEPQTRRVKRLVLDRRPGALEP